jgi:hypothetical protein
MGIGPGAAPPLQGSPPPAPLIGPKATPSHYAVDRAIAEALKPWDEPNATAPASAPGWRTFFDGLKGELASYASAVDESSRFLALERLQKMDQALGTVTWSPAAQIHSALEEWLAPRMRVASAERRLLEYIAAHKTDPSASSEKSRLWEKFVGEDLVSAISSYEGARTVQERSAALKRLTGVLAALRHNNQSVPWPYSQDLQAALDGLYNRPNFDVWADEPSVSPILANDVVQSGPIYRRGYVSQVTAGPRTGFGLLPSDEGIAFFNSQSSSTYTPITDFQDQLEQDRRGRQVARLYYFQAASYDTPELTITAIIRPSTGLSLTPSFTHCVGASFDATPIHCTELTRAALASIGLNREKLIEKVREQATPRIAEGVVEGATEEAAERMPGEEARQNANLRRVLVGNDTAAVGDFRITGLSFRSNPKHILVSGKVGHETLPDAIGADMQKPPRLIEPAPGVTADVHLGSVLSNAVAGLLQGNEVRGVDNVMIVTKAVQPGAPPKEGVTIGKNIDFPTFLKQIEEARAANNPNVTAIRIKKPGVPPEFAADDRGFLVILVRDFQMDVPAAPGAERGGLLGLPRGSFAS